MQKTTDTHSQRVTMLELISSCVLILFCSACLFQYLSKVHWYRIARPLRPPHASSSLKWSSKTGGLASQVYLQVNVAACFCSWQSGLRLEMMVNYEYLLSQVHKNNNNNFDKADVLAPYWASFWAAPYTPNATNPPC